MQLLPEWFKPLSTVRITPERGLYSLDEQQKFVERCFKAAEQIGVACDVRAKTYGITEIVTGDWTFPVKGSMPRPAEKEILLWGAWLNGEIVHLPASWLGRSPDAFVHMIRRLVKTQGWQGQACATEFGAAFYISRFPKKSLNNSGLELARLGMSRGGRPIYPWAEWLDGEEHTIFRGVDFDCAMESMRVNLSNAWSTKLGRERGFNGVTSHKIDGGGLTFRFLDRTAGRRPATISADGEAPSTQEV